MLGNARAYISLYIYIYIYIFLTGELKYLNLVSILSTRTIRSINLMYTFAIPNSPSVWKASLVYAHVLPVRGDWIWTLPSLPPHPPFRHSRSLVYRTAGVQRVLGTFGLSSRHTGWGKGGGIQAMVVRPGGVHLTAKELAIQQRPL